MGTPASKMGPFWRLRSIGSTNSSRRTWSCIFTGNAAWKGYALLSGGAAIAVETGEDKVHAEVAEDGGGGTDDGEDGRPLAPPAAGDPCMQISRINEPDDERPGFLRIPAPVCPPRHVGPEGARYNAD